MPEILGMQACKICDFGLVMNSIIKYFKTTINFLATIKLASIVMKILGIECKIRENASADL